MACEVLLDKDGRMVAIMCGSPWGIGMYDYGDGEDSEGSEIVYGFPPKYINPHKFTPDGECCSEQEIANWKEACDLWDKWEAAEKAT